MSTLKVYAYYPGCSLEGMAREAEEAFFRVAAYWNINLKEIPDWNCCGSSSAHSICHDLALKLAWRVLALCPEDTTEILTMCPSCYTRLRVGFAEALERKEEFLALFGKEPNSSWRVRHFVEVLGEKDWQKVQGSPLAGLRLAPYYGCLLFGPAKLPQEIRDGVLEEMLASLGAQVVSWRYAKQCCGTYLSIVRPDFVSEIVAKMTDEAYRLGIDALVTPCVMCQLNLEMRAKEDSFIPIFHLSEILALALKQGESSWFKRHLIDPLPLLMRKGLLP
ncbi:heterodisulfide reductase-related iron-sulfur binding cluster [Thermodesulfatator atlanticus]|uniref:heterodisulfide reductase-related iron-sulfur binding cluster n=1 Tax=Thermodesulfatator atlanticus TaxID=501497 RepID=UPI0003B37004|nr:heterodisulfide reductase-related iron-sulfur binding cluster [Thermodesulfatator atlanticus]